MIAKHHSGHQKKSGFTLIELLVVIAIIGIVAAIAIPNLLRSRMSAQQVAAEGALKTICEAQIDFYNNSVDKTYATSLQLLGNGLTAGGVPFIDSKIASGLKSGYTFEMAPGGYNASSGSYYAWSATAWPVSFKSTGTTTYYIDETGLIRGEDVGGARGDVNMRFIGQ